MLEVPITNSRAVRLHMKDGPLQGSIWKECFRCGPPMLELQLDVRVKGGGIGVKCKSRTPRRRFCNIISNEIRLFNGKCLSIPDEHVQ